MKNVNGAVGLSFYSLKWIAVQYCTLRSVHHIKQISTAPYQWNYTAKYFRLCSYNEATYLCPKSQILCSTLQTNSVKYNVVTVFLVKNCLGSYVNLCAYTKIQVKFTVDVIFSGKENILHNAGCENSV